MTAAGLSSLVVEVLHNRGDDNHPDWSVGSGFFVGTSLVLTALHNVDGPGEVLVRVHGTEEHPAVVCLQGNEDMVDLAVLEVPDAEVDVPTLRYGAVDRSAQAVLEHCWAVGFPRFKERVHDPKPLRLSAQVNGEIPTGENLDQPLLTLQVSRSPRPLPSGAVRESEWAGMSGATVFSGNNIIVGVITEHHLPEGESALTVVPITAIDLLPEAEATKWWKLLGVGNQALVRLPGEAPSSLSPSARPESFIPIPRSPLFQPRPDEFEYLEHLLFESKKENPSPRLGLVGMAGVGKTQLAVELAHRCLDQNRFPAGIFWMTATGKELYDWQPRFAQLARDTRYLPPDDDISSAENERRRAIHFCRYLANHADALLILDNVDAPNLVISALPAFAGKDAACCILYTSRSTLAPPGTMTHPVGLLPEEGALRLLLETTRPALLSEVAVASLDEEARSARSICLEVGYLPLALVHLRGLLARDQRITLVRLAEVLKQRGALDLAKTQQGDAKPLFEVFRLSWEKVQNEDAQRLFKLASYFPEAIPIPLWLLGLAAGLGESGDFFEPLGKALLDLQELSLIEELSREQARLHPLVQEFGRRLVTEEGERGMTMLEEAGERLALEIADLNNLERRAFREGYGVCLEQVRAVCEYAASLSTTKIEQLRWIERQLDQESYLLGNEQWWPKTLPGLFHQQLFNRSVEEGHPLVIKEAPERWLLQENQVGTGDQSLLRVFADRTGQVESVAFSPDGSKVLTGAVDRTARLWETASGKLLTTYEGHTRVVMSVAFSPDGSKVLTGSWDGTARLWEAASGKLLGTYEVSHTEHVESVAFSPDGSKALTGSTDGIARLWETASGELLRTYEGYNSMVLSVAFSPDGSKVLTGADDRTARLWETASGKLLRTYEGHTGLVESVAFSPDGSKVLTTGSWDGTARLWETASGELLRTYEHHTHHISSAAFSPDGGKVLTGSWDQTAGLWEAASGKLLKVYQGHADVVNSVAFSPDGSKVLTGADDETARLWETASGKTLAREEGHADVVNSVAFSPDGSKALTGSTDGIARLWETASGELLRTYEGHTGSVESVAFSPDGSKALTGSTDRIARLWETASGELLRTYEGHSGQVRSVAFSPDGSKVLTGSDRIAWLWETASGELLTTYEGHSDQVNSVAFSPDGSKVLTGSWDGTAWLWETASLALTHMQQVVYDKLGIKVRGKLLKGKLLVTYEGHSGQVRSVAFSPDGSKVLTGATDRTARLWETASGKLLVTYEGHTGSVESVAFSPNGHLIITCTLHGHVFIWQMDGSKLVHPLGLYVAAYRVGAIRWQDAIHVVLAECVHLHICRLKLEGKWEQFPSKSIS